MNCAASYRRNRHVLIEYSEVAQGQFWLAHGILLPEEV